MPRRITRSTARPRGPFTLALLCALAALALISGCGGVFDHSTDYSRANVACTDNAFFYDVDPKRPTNCAPASAGCRRSPTPTTTNKPVTTL